MRKFGPSNYQGCTWMLNDNEVLCLLLDTIIVSIERSLSFTIGLNQNPCYVKSKVRVAQSS